MKFIGSLTVKRSPRRALKRFTSGVNYSLQRFRRARSGLVGGGVGPPWPCLFARRLYLCGPFNDFGMHRPCDSGSFQ
jgi:hypothetical protein